MYEGGIRVPFIISGNLVSAKGAISEKLVQTVDIFSTVLEIMDGRPNINKKIDSYSLVPLMKSPSLGLRNYAFSELKGPGRTCDFPARGLIFSYGDALIGEKYKLISPFEYDSSDNVVDLPEEFYNLHDDPFERHNLLHDGEDSMPMIDKIALRNMRNKRLEILESK